MARPGTFQKGHKLAKGSNGQLRRDLTLELIQQLNELDPNNKNRTKMARLMRNLIARATYGSDTKGPKGKVKEGLGDLAAQMYIFDRLEGRPAQDLNVRKNTNISDCSYAVTQFGIVS